MMIGFPQSTLPLTANLKVPPGPAAIEVPATFNQLVQYLVDNSRGIMPKAEYYWIHDSESLFSPKLRGLDGKRVHFFKTGNQRLWELLWNRTYWLKRLPESGKNKVRALIQSRAGRGFLKECLNTADGLTISLLFSTPELFLGGYEFSDRLHNLVLMNCFHNYSRFQKDLKLARKTIKKYRLLEEEVILPKSIWRTLSFLRPMLRHWDAAPGSKRSKSAIFRIATFSQTRATGLADARMQRESIDDYIVNVTTPKDFSPDDLLKIARDTTINHIISNPWYGKNPEFRISASSAACREYPRSRGGKFGWIHDYLRQNHFKVPPLQDGTPGYLGNLLYDKAKHEFRKRNKKLLEVNVAAIRENGKARVVTSGSMLKEAALQPYSHLTIHMIKTIPNLAQGLGAGRLGWRFIRNVNPENEKFAFVFERDGKVYMMSMDWSKATDGPTHEMGRWVIEPLLRASGVPDEDIEMIFYYWLSPKSLFVDGKCVGKSVRGLPMGDPMTKTALSLAHPICDLYARISTGTQAVEEGNGDDVIAIIEDPSYMEAYQKAAVMLGFEISELDTFLTQDWGTYCEEWFHIPVAKTNTVKTAAKTRQYLQLPYLDAPKIRLLIATEKDRRDFSSDPAGKITMMGKEMDYLRSFNKNPAILTNFVASGLQDVSLAVDDQPFPYNLPRELLGLGKPEPRWNPLGWASSVQRYSPRKKSIVWFLLTVALRDRIDVIPKGHVRSAVHFNKESYLEYFKIPRDDPVRAYIVVPAEDRGKFPPGLLSRLVQSRHLVPESRLIAYYLMQERINDMNAELQDVFETVEKTVENIEIPTLDEVDWLNLITDFRNKFYHRTHDLKPESIEDLYDVEAILKLENGNPLRVTDVNIPVLQKFNRSVMKHSAHDIEAEELYNWFWENREAVLNGETIYTGTLPPIHLADDDLIFAQASLRETPLYIVVTDDKRLCRRLQDHIIGITVVQVPCEDLVKLVGEDMDAEKLIETLSPMYGVPSEEMTFLVDTGSIESFLLRREIRGKIMTVVNGLPWTATIDKKRMVRSPVAVLKANSVANPSTLGYPKRGFEYRRKRGFSIR